MEKVCHKRELISAGTLKSQNKNVYAMYAYYFKMN
jgi:hypothetical protein